MVAINEIKNTPKSKVDAVRQNREQLAALRRNDALARLALPSVLPLDIDTKRIVFSGNADGIRIETPKPSEAFDALVAYLEKQTGQVLTISENHGHSITLAPQAIETMIGEEDLSKFNRSMQWMESAIEKERLDVSLRRFK